jgi:hypothetical protein
MSMDEELTWKRPPNYGKETGFVNETSVKIMGAVHCMKNAEVKNRTGRGLRRFSKLKEV